jgi:FAD/FMN-containing dehydrogenase
MGEFYHGGTVGRARPTVPDARGVVAKLRGALGPEQVLTTREVLARQRYLFHWPPLPRATTSAAHLGPPAAAIRPRSTEDVALVLREANEAGLPVVPYGGGTGVMGGARPVAGGLLLDLRAMNRILDVDAAGLVARVEPGVILADLARRADEQGLLFAHDPWSQAIATVGGAVGTNGVGYLAAGYGAMGDQIRGLEAVLANGSIVSWTDAPKFPGPTLWRLFVGSEGTLGVISRVDVQLFPRPAVRGFLAMRFPTFGDGFAAIHALRDRGLHPVMIDFEEVEDAAGPPLEVDADLNLAFDGPPAVVEAAIAEACVAGARHRGRDLGAEAARDFWEHRHDVADWFTTRPPEFWERRRGPFSDVYVNLVVPVGSVLDYCAQVRGLAREHQVSVESFGIWGRPEFLSFTLSASSGGDALDRATDAALRLARQMGGSIEYCHGAGVRLAHLLDAELASAQPILHQIKAALDPSGILNPGKLGLVTNRPVAARPPRRI